MTYKERVLKENIEYILGVCYRSSRALYGAEGFAILDGNAELESTIGGVRAGLQNAYLNVRNKIDKIEGE